MAKNTRAIVIGGSMVGMMTAKVLSERFSEVLVIERDSLNNDGDARNGAPQGRHLHLLLPKGQDLMESYFPGLGDELTALGAPVMRWGYDNLMVLPSGNSLRVDNGVRSNIVSRVTLEATVRERMSKIDNITTIRDTQVDHLVHDSGRITGVDITNRKTKYSETITGDLIVDVSGRGSKTPQWLQDHGYSAPEETEVNSYIGYATRWFRVPEHYTPDYLMIGIAANPSENNMRAGGLLFLEDNKVVVTLQGSNRDYPPTDEDGFMAFAKSLPEPYVYDFMQVAEPISPIYGFRKSGNKIRHYERLVERPENFIVLGDAFCSFNPIYGQGMTAGALEVNVLRDLLKRYSVGHLDGFAAQFQQKIVKAIAGAWMSATAEDMRYPDTEGAEPTLMLRIAQTYSEWLLDTSAHDEVIYDAFFHMINLDWEGIAVLRPNVLARMVWHKFIRPKPRRQLEQGIIFDIQYEREPSFA